MANNLKRILAVIMAMSMTFSMLSVDAAATEDDGTEPAIELATLELPESLKEGITVSYGTEWETVLKQLPDTLDGIVVQTETPEETPSENPEETPSENPEETPSENPEETPSENPEETPSENPEETPSENPEETPSENPEETPSENPEETPSENPEETPSENPEETPSENPGETPSENPGETPSENPEETPSENPEEAPDKTPDGTSDESGTVEDIVAISYSAGSDGEETDNMVTVPVVWSCDDYNGWTAETYTIKATLGEGYSYADIDSLSVTVTVDSPAGAVAKIGDTTYTTLDEAVEKAAEGATIELLANCKLEKGFNKTLTFTGNGKIRIDKQLTSNGEGWMCFGLGDPTRVLTFDGPGVEVEWYSEVGTAPWLMLSLSGTLNVTNGAKLTFNVDSGATGSRNAIYMNAGAEINVSNGSTFIINGYGTAGTVGQGIQLDETAQSDINVTGNSTFLIDGTNRGYVNSPNIYVEDSTFTVQNCTANASNGGKFTAINSKITYQDNAGHGLSAGNVDIQNSTVECNGNGLFGLTYSGNMTVDGTSVISANGNAAKGSGAGIRASSASGVSLVKAGATVEILNNQHNGLENYGTFTFEEGVTLRVKGNDERTTNGGGVYNAGVLVLPSDTEIVNNHAKKIGGGICNDGTMTVPAGVVLYNNHADGAGDDIGCNSTGKFTNASITFGQVGSGWVLDDCNDNIDGWYQDGAGNRWSAHKTPLYAYEFTDYGEAAVGSLALKAAHGLVPVEPDDPEAPEWEISKSKTATNLDSNYESQITLALPAADYKGNLDVVFVLDGSTSTDENDLATAAASLLDTLSAYENLNVKAGVVIFGGYVPVLYSNEDLLPLSDDANVATLKNVIMDKSYDGIEGRSGSNLQAGVETAQAMLDKDTAVASADKYMIILSDGAARMWYEDGQAMSQAYYPSAGSNGDGFWWNSNSDFSELRYAGGKPGPVFSDVWNLGQNGKDIGAYGLSYADKESGNYTSDDIAPYEVMMNGDYHTTYEAATYYAATSIVEAAQKNQVIFVTYGYHDETNFGQYIESFKAWLEDNNIVKRYNSETLSATDIFSAVEDEIIQLVAAGSKVVDVIGSGSDYNFDFVNDIDKLTITVGGKELTKTAISNTSYGFGGTGTDYDFVVTYYADGQDGECFVWDINVPVTKSAPVKLTYSVKLTDPQTASGTYGQYDADGSKGYAGLYTNDSAVLYPVDSKGVQGFPENFAKPTVSYTISGGGSSGGGGGTVTPDPDPGTDIEDPDTPLDPGPGGETDIEDPDTPLDPGTDIEDPDTPLGNLPQTGVAEAVNPYMTAGLMALAAAMTMAGLYFSRKRGKREDA